MNIHLSKLYAALSNNIRLRCLFVISNMDEVCVCDIVETLRITQPTASKALNCLKEVDLISDRRDANWNYYRVNTDMENWQKSIYKVTIKALKESNEFSADHIRIKKLVGARCCP